MNYIQRLKRILIFFLLPIISYGLLGPLEIYSGNQKDFSFRLADFFWIFLGISFISWIVISLICALFNEHVVKWLCTLVLGFGVASYIQNMFMNIKLSEIDGSPMNWEQLHFFSYINLAIWGLIIGIIIFLSVRFKTRWSQISAWLAFFLCTIQLVAVITLVAGAYTEKTYTEELQMSGENQFNVSSGHNIIVFVLDTFGNTQLENALDEYPDLLAKLSDFTFYDNADCHYYCTFPSMTHMLTGIELDFDVTAPQWMENAWQSDKAKKFYNTLSENGYICNLYSAGNIGYEYGEIENLNDKFNNICTLESTIDYKNLICLLGKMSAYRYVPYVIKPYYEVLTEQFSDIVTFKKGKNVVNKNVQFYDALMKNNLKINPDYPNAMIIQHLSGTHKPYVTDENAGLVEESSVNQTIHGLFVICEEYINQLKELGVYDNATIIITADHGSWHNGDPQPILFVKNSGETNEQIKINSAPVSLDDFQATVLSIIGEDYAEYGTAIFDWDPGVERLRTVYMRQRDEKYPDVQGSSFNVYYKYSYYKDKKELVERVENGEEEVVMATPW